MNETRLPAPMAEFQRQFFDRGDLFKRSLPRAISLDYFQSVVLQAVMRNRRLLECNRQSLFESCMNAATDGLVCDGREAVLVEYYDSRKGKIVQYQPMVAGIRKLARQSGLLRNWDVYAVGANDVFSFQLGDHPSIHHEPNLDDPGPLRAVYSVVTLKDGDISREVMSRAACERIRNRAQAWRAFKEGKIKSTPWESDFEEMCKKTVVKLHGKRLPKNRELETVLDRDDAMFQGRDEVEALEEPRVPRRGRKSAPPPPEPTDDLALDAAGGDSGDDAHDPDDTQTNDDDGGQTVDAEFEEVEARLDFEAGESAYRDHVPFDQCADAAIAANPDRINRWRAGWRSAASAQDAKAKSKHEPHQ